MFTTVSLGVLGPASSKLDDINGGHIPLYVIGKDGVKAELTPTGPVIELMEGIYIYI